LQKQAQKIASRRQNLVQNIYVPIYNLIIIQRIYYMAGRDEEANQMATRVNEITADRLQFPQNKEQNKEQIEQSL
jgi:hypothetical protein